MRALRRFFTRLLGVMTMLLRDEQPGDVRLREEMESHIAAQADENTRSGMTPQEAHRRARLKFGAVERSSRKLPRRRGPSLRGDLPTGRSLCVPRAT